MTGRSHGELGRFTVYDSAVRRGCATNQSTHTHTHTFNGPLSETTQVSRYQKGKTNGATENAGPENAGQKVFDF